MMMIVVMSYVNISDPSWWSCVNAFSFLFFFLEKKKKRRPVKCRLTDVLKACKNL